MQIDSQAFASFIYKCPLNRFSLFISLILKDKGGHCGLILFKLQKPSTLTDVYGFQCVNAAENTLKNNLYHKGGRPSWGHIGTATALHRCRAHSLGGVCIYRSTAPAIHTDTCKMIRNKTKRSTFKNSAHAECYLRGWIIPVASVNTLSLHLFQIPSQ